MGEYNHRHDEETVESDAFIKHMGAMTGESLHSKAEIAAELAYRDNVIFELKARIHEAYEVYAGMEGFKPVTAPEGYLLRVIGQMVAELKPSKQGGGNG